MKSKLNSQGLVGWAELGASYWDCRVDAQDVADFLSRYYKPSRYTGRGPEYAAVLLASHQADFDRNGWDTISHYDSRSGEEVAFFGPLGQGSDEGRLWQALDGQGCGIIVVLATDADAARERVRERLKDRRDDLQQWQAGERVEPVDTDGTV
jgi:hypothetical protein